MTALAEHDPLLYPHAAVSPYRRCQACPPPRPPRRGEDVATTTPADAQQVQGMRWDRWDSWSPADEDQPEPAPRWQS